MVRLTRGALGTTYARPGAPAFGADVTVPASTIARHVFGNLSMTGDATVVQHVTISIESGVGTGVFQGVQEVRLPAGTTGAYYVPYAFVVPGGRRYRFTLTSGASPSIAGYQYTDVR